MTIIISQNNSNAKKINESKIEKEDYLQNYIYNNPDVIPMYDIEEDRRLLILKREFNTNSGPIDALAIDGDGNIYIIETKLYKNSDKRTVVAQALDYGAALWRRFNDFNKFIQILDEETKNKFRVSLEDRIKEFFDLDDDGYEFVLERLESNLNKGNIKFVILMDSMDERLRDLILYVNQNSKFDIYAVQLKYYKFDQYEIMVPKIFGVEVKKDIKISSQYKRKWDESSFFNKAKKILDERDIRKIENLYNFAKKNGEIVWGKGKEPTFSMELKLSELQTSIFTLFAKGRCWISVGNIAKYFGNKVASQLASEIKKIGIEITEKKDLKRAYPEFHITKLSDNQVEIFKEIIINAIK